MLDDLEMLYLKTIGIDVPGRPHEPAEPEPVIATIIPEASKMAADDASSVSSDLTESYMTVAAETTMSKRERRRHLMAQLAALDEDDE